MGYVDSIASPNDQLSEIRAQDYERCTSLRRRFAMSLVPAGCMINKIIEETDVKIDIEQDGTVSTSLQPIQRQMRRAKEIN